ncbi:MAG: WD40 repeat domain-containing protein [Nakamurella sp.]
MRFSRPQGAGVAAMLSSVVLVSLVLSAPGSSAAPAGRAATVAQPAGAAAAQRQVQGTASPAGPVRPALLTAAGATDASASPSLLTAAASAAPNRIGTPARTRTYDGGYLQGTTRTTANGEAFSAAVVGNVTNHTDGDTDIIGAYLDGTVHVWSQKTGRQLFVVQTGGPIAASPGLFRMKPGGQLYVTIANKAGHVYVYSFTGGRTRVVFHKQVSYEGKTGVFGTPVVADLDKNGKMYLVATAWTQHVYVWDIATGANKRGFPIWVKDTVWSSPVVSDIDNDGYSEIIFGYDCGGGGTQICHVKYKSKGGFVTVYDHNGRLRPGWPKFIPGQVVWSTPAVANIVGDSGKEIIVGTGLFWPGAGKQTWVLDRNGRTIKTVPMLGRTFASPAIGDVLHTGRAQIVITDDTGYTDIIDTNWHRLAHVCTARISGGRCATSHTSPIIGDVNNDGYQEVITAGSNSFYVIDHTRKAVVSVQIPETFYGLSASPTLVNRAGRATLYFALMAKSSGGNRAQVMAYTFPTAAGNSAWPTFKVNAARNGVANQATVNPPVGQTR